MARRSHAKGGGFQVVRTSLLESVRQTGKPRQEAPLTAIPMLLPCTEQRWAVLTKSLIKVGNSYAIVLDRTLMDLVGISPEIPVTIEVQGHTLSLSSSASGLGVDQAMDRVFTTHAEALRRLAK